MDRSLTTPETPPAARLDYPFTPPLPGRSLEVAPGVHWVRMPLPYALDHINLWALEDGDGWTLVDTGVGNPVTVRRWQRLWAREGGRRPLKRVIVTHMHPDHVGMAGFLTRQMGARLWMSRLEYLHCRSLVADNGREAPPDALAFYRRAGWGEAAIAVYQTRFGHFGKQIYPLPDSYRRLQDGERFRIGAFEWEVVMGSGHSPEHACLYCAERKLLISGDQVLPKISSNVSVHPLEPDADPMGDWLASLDALEARLPGDVLVLPAHNECFYGLHTRIAQLRQGQHRALDRLRQRLQEPRRCVDVFGALFARAIGQESVGLLGLATGESLACLNYLVQRGEAWVERDAQGVDWYRLAG